MGQYYSEETLLDSMSYRTRMDGRDFAGKQTARVKLDSQIFKKCVKTS